MSSAASAGAGALARLGALHIPAYVVDDRVHGRLRVDPKRLAGLEGLSFERNHAFVMQGTDTLVFVPPSPLSLLPSVSIAGLTQEREIVARLESRWATRVEGLRTALGRARALAEAAAWSAEPLGLEAKVQQDDGEVLLRFSDDGASVWVGGVGGTRLTGNAAAETASLAVHVDAPRDVVQDGIARGVKRARELNEALRGSWEAVKGEGAPPSVEAADGGRKLGEPAASARPGALDGAALGAPLASAGPEDGPDEAWVVRSQPLDLPPSRGESVRPMTSDPERAAAVSLVEAYALTEEPRGRSAGAETSRPGPAAAPPLGEVVSARSAEGLRSAAALFADDAADQWFGREPMHMGGPAFAEDGSRSGDLALASLPLPTGDVGRALPTAERALAGDGPRMPLPGDGGRPLPTGDVGRPPEKPRSGDLPRVLRSGDLPLAPLGAPASPPPLEHVATADLRIEVVPTNVPRIATVDVPLRAPPPRSDADDVFVEDAAVARRVSPRGESDAIAEIEPPSLPPPLPLDEADDESSGSRPAPVVPLLGSRPAPGARSPAAPAALRAAPATTSRPGPGDPRPPPDGGAPRQGRAPLNPFDDPFVHPDDQAPVGDEPPADDEEPTAYVARPKRVEVDGAAVLRVRGRSLPARVYNLSATGAFISVDLEELPALGEEVELGATGYRPVRARVMHGRPRDEANDVPAGLGLELLPDPSTRHATTIPHVLLVSPDPEMRRRLASVVAGIAMLPVPASDVVAAYVATHTMPVSALVLDPAVQQLGDWRDLAEGFGVAQRGTPVIALQEPGRRLRGLPAWIVPSTLEALGRALLKAIGR